MAKKPHYDDKFRASAVVMLQAAGYPDKEGALASVAAHLGLHARTLSRWANGEQNPPPDQSVSIEKIELADKLEALAHKIVGCMPDKLDEATLQQSAVSLGIIVEKLQLLRGQPTDRSEVVDNLNDDERASRIAALLDAARARRNGRAADG